MRALGDSFAGTVPSNRRLVSEAIDRGVPLDEVQKSSNIAVATRKLLLPRGTAKTKPSRPSTVRGGFDLIWARR
jgi:pilus assembly protein CpaE